MSAGKMMRYDPRSNETGLPTTKASRAYSIGPDRIFQHREWRAVVLESCLRVAAQRGMLSSPFNRQFLRETLR